MFFLRHRLGASALEFALVAPMLVLVLFGVLQFGQIYYVRAAITDTARDVARQLSVAAITPSQARDYILAGMPLQTDVAPEIGIAPVDTSDIPDALNVGYRIRVSLPMSEVVFANPLDLVGSGDLEVDMLFFAEPGLLTAP